MARVTVDEIVSTYELDTDKYVQGVQKVNAANASLNQSTASASSGISGLGSALGAAAMNPMAMVAAAGAIAVSKSLDLAREGVQAFAEQAKRSFQDFAGFESMAKGLNAVEGNAGLARKAIKDLYDIAKAPGIGYEESVKGYQSLRFAQLDPMSSRELVKQLGNANASAGGNRDTFDRAIYALSQIQGNNRVNGDDLRQLVNAGIPIRRFMKDRFGVTDTDKLESMNIDSTKFIQGLIEELQKLPRVAGGAQNSLENLQTSLHMASVNFGESIASLVVPMIDEVTASFDTLSEAGVWADTMYSMSDSLGLSELNAKGLTGALIEMNAAMRTNAQIAGAAKDGLSAAIPWLKGIAGALPMGNALGAGLDAVKTGMDVYGVLNNQNKSDIEAAIAAQKYIDDKRRQERPSALSRQVWAAGGMGDDPGAQRPEKQTNRDLLAEIAGNTRPMRDLKQMILGGGALTGRGISKQELSDLGRGRGRGGDRITRAVQMFSDEIIQALLESQEISRREA